ncbi:TetR family transcriptional regulator [Scytonema sp. UIC 10036]|uniref:TetR/AcrR family transcriptional regulator n=1 Tax=Scytonema sp. UIC 10036 TaxID=2304196 RepID=UPI0012DAE7BE|nr:TetR/AcrR family transcriptional regulator [Scytonema sp. UIC 10036]MUG94873.1 TetR family transcriptional regulator [Scytonema sp. UIC 10036]
MSRKIPTKPRKLPQQDRSKMTVDAILIATAHILTEEGYDTASTNRIAERAGVSIGSLYQYFPNKEALVAALAESHANEMIEIVESNLRDSFDKPIEVVFRELVKACIAAHAVNPKLHKVLNEEVPRIGKLKKVKNAEEQINTLVRAYLEKQRDRIQPQNLDLTVFILGCVVESLAHTAVIEHPEFLSDGQIEQEIVNLLLSYLVGKRS